MSSIGHVIVANDETIRHLRSSFRPIPPIIGVLVGGQDQRFADDDEHTVLIIN